jgi:ethanolamine ammonia-lyase small subunit
VVYLRVGVDSQLKRLGRDRARPLLQRGDREQVLRDLAAIREPLYAEVADLMLDTDGLSPGAMQGHGSALALAIATSEQLRGWTIGPITVVTNGRVATGDEIGAALGARLVVVLIGERPGLSVPESIGAYLTFTPAPGRSDADRNCISNIHDHGLPIEAAARQIAALARRARLAGLTGVALKDDDPLRVNRTRDQYSFE